MPSGAGRRPRRRLGIAVTLLAIGAAILVGAGLLRHREQPAPNVGVGHVDRLAGVASPPPAAASPPTVTASEIPTLAATLPTSAPVIRPARIRIDRLNVSATVVPVGVDAAGEVVVPPSVDTVGWYRYGPGLGMPGSMVVAGHVDSAQQGNGAFARLRMLGTGDRVEVTGTDGHVAAYRVVGREEYPKATIQLDRYFTSTGPQRLTLITCGGPFNQATGHYRDNVVVTAVPASS
ncbi:class F sortase [Paractinoplanes tereljensis]|uniref:class F sortase n=1 Tax=Paractinoplanes tereljensis TaxID=571912 RepID=UPI0019453C13